MSTETTPQAQAEQPAADFDAAAILERMAAERARLEAWHTENNALAAVELDALPGWVWRCLLGAGDGRTLVSLQRWGERSELGPLHEFYIRIERGVWLLDVGTDRGYYCLDCKGHAQDMGPDGRSMLADLAAMLTDPRVRGLYHETPRQAAARALLGTLDDDAALSRLERLAEGMLAIAERRAEAMGEQPAE